MLRICSIGFAAMFVVAACAMGGSPTSGPDDAAHGGNKDAHYITGDARPPADAHVYTDAPATQHDAATTPDAGGSGGFCQVNSDCPDQAQCCYLVACVNGTRVGNNLCFPM